MHVDTWIYILILIHTHIHNLDQAVSTDKKRDAGEASFDDKNDNNNDADNDNDTTLVKGETKSFPSKTLPTSHQTEKISKKQKVWDFHDRRLWRWLSQL